MIGHIVLFNPKSNASKEQLRSFAQSISTACQSIPSVQRALVGKRLDIDAGYGRDFGDKTYQYVAIIEFADASGLVQYLQHPLHQDLGQLFWEMCESTVIVEVDLTDGKAEGVENLLS
jgi:hypothetical protein